ncbi:MAG TPA: hypothetical protein VG294_02050 [Solirubrobacteraceae bacterium]|nr:hypothetical protein [Solirubrobacteraceae bacterium]
MPSHADRPSFLDLIFDLFEFTVGLGILVMALSPFAVPGIVIVLVPLMVIGLAGAMVALALGLPVILLVRVTRRARGAVRGRRAVAELPSAGRFSRSARKSSQLR